MDELLKALDISMWPLRYQCKVTHSGAIVIFQRGGMQATASDIGGGLIEVVYEHALHEVTRERCTPKQAADLLRQVFQRENLCKLDSISEMD